VTRIVKKSDLYSLHDAPGSKNIKECIEGILSQQGLRNTAMADPQPIMEHFAKLWADLYGKVLRDVGEKLDAFARKKVAQAFEHTDEVPIEARRAVAALREVVGSKLDSLRDEAAKCTARLIRYSLPPLVFTTNEHYLTAIYKSFVSNTADKKPTDNCSATLLYLKWLAFRKVQVKVVVEAAAKDFIGLYTIDLDKVLKEVLDSFTATATVQLVENESADRTSSRNTAKLELEELHKILNMFN
jgi:hypothetical protein